VAHHARPARADPGTHRQRELGAAPHPGLMRQDQALSLSRPLRRRAARMARPARVRMRSRNPCVLARRRLFGWNVRLLTGTPGGKGLDLHRTARAGAGRPVLTSRFRMGTRGARGSAYGPGIAHRLPSGTPAFGPRALFPRLRLWKAIPPSCRSHRTQPGGHVHNMWIALWIASSGPRPGNARGAHR
jgi:hypothetical protein